MHGNLPLNFFSCIGERAEHHPGDENGPVVHREVPISTEVSEKRGVPAAVQVWAGAVIVFVLTVAAYATCLKNGFVNVDDPAYITGNPVVQHFGWASLRDIWLNAAHRPYYPVVYTVYMAQHALWGNWAGGYHATSVILHALNAALVLGLVWRLFGSRTAAVVAGLLMGLHPLHVDSVAWVAHFKDVLSAFWVLMAMHSYVSYVKTGHRRWHGIALLLYTLALLSKPMAALLPFMLLIVDYQPRRKNRRLELLEKAPFFAVALALGVVAVYVQALGGGVTAQAGEGFYSRLNAWTALGAYVIKLVMPIRLSVLYASANPGWWNTLAIMLTVAYITMTIWMMMISRDYGFGLAWFLLLAIPILGFVPFGHVMRVAPVANHFVYLADIGIFTCGGLLARDILKGLQERPPRMMFFCVVLAVFALYTTKTVLRCGVWQNSETYWRDALRYNDSPNSSIAHQNLALVLRDKGDMAGALEQAREAVRVYPQSEEARKLAANIQKQRPGPSEP